MKEDEILRIAHILLMVTGYALVVIGSYNLGKSKAYKEMQRDTIDKIEDALKLSEILSKLMNKLNEKEDG